MISTKEEGTEAPVPDREGETLAQDMTKTEETIETRVLNTEMTEERGGGSMAMAMRSEGTAQGPQVM